MLSEDITLHLLSVYSIYFRQLSLTWVTSNENWDHIKKKKQTSSGIVGLVLTPVKPQMAAKRPETLTSN